MSILNITKENFEETKNNSSTLLIDFYADWCGPCKMVAPIVEQIADEHPEYTVGKINVDLEPELAGEFGVMSIPTLAVLKNGEVISKSVGAKPKAAILKLLEN